MNPSLVLANQFLGSAPRADLAARTWDMAPQQSPKQPAYQKVLNRDALAFQPNLFCDTPFASDLQHRVIFRWRRTCHLLRWGRGSTGTSGRNMVPDVPRPRAHPGLCPWRNTHGRSVCVAHTASLGSAGLRSCRLRDAHMDLYRGCHHRLLLAAEPVLRVWRGRTNSRLCPAWHCPGSRFSRTRRSARARRWMIAKESCHSRPAESNPQRCLCKEGQTKSHLPPPPTAPYTRRSDDGA